MPQSRRLTAIMFADIAGYTAMMQRNEKDGLEKVHRFSEVMEAQASANNGEILEFRGDGCLAVFNSAVEAMHAAKAIQESLKEEPKVPLRIGIHIGDIVFTDGNIYGDGVNLASRVESMGVPGSILVTERVIHDVKSHPEFEMASLGKFQFKNVEKPLEVFALANEGFIVPKPGEIAGKGKALASDEKQGGKMRSLILAAVGLLVGGFLIWGVSSLSNEKTPPVSEKPLIKEKSIAVLPFRNLSNDPDQEFFSDGVTEDILVNLAKIQQLKVIARSSSFSFKGQDIPSPEIAERLQVNHILEGSVRKYGQKIRINTELVHAASGEMLWVESYDRKLEDVFLVQEELAKEIANALSLKLSTKETEDLSRATKVDPKAYQYATEVKRLLMSFSLDDFNTAKDLLQEAIELDSTFDEPYILLANYYINRAIWVGDLPSKEALASTQTYLSKAQSLNPTSRSLNRAMGMADLWLKWDFESAEKHLLKSGYEGAFPGVIFIYYTYLGELEKLGKALEELKEIDPFNPDIYSSEALFYYYSKDIPKAIEACQTSIRVTPDRGDSYKFLANIYREQGKPEEAIRVLEARMKIMEFRPPFFLGELAASYSAAGYADKAQEVIQELHALIENQAQGSPHYFLAMAYANLGEKDKAFELLEQSFELREVEMVWLKMDPLARPLHAEPRYQDLLDRVGFP